MTSQHEGATPLLGDCLIHATRRWVAKVALVCAEQRLTFGELDGYSNALAHALAR